MELFDLSVKTNNSKFTKVFVEKNRGHIPVYGASKNEKTVDYGYIKDNLEGIKYFRDCLTWNIDGSIGKVFLRQGIGLALGGFDLFNVQVSRKGIVVCLKETTMCLGG